MTPFLKELLLITNPNVLALADYLNRTALLFILPCFYLGLVCEYLSNWDFKGVVKRSMIAFLAIKLLAPLHVSFVNESLTISSQLVTKYSPQNKFLTAYRNVKMDKKAGVWKKLSSIVELIVTDPIVLIIFLLSYIAFFLLTQLYSLVYHLGIVLIGVCAILSIFPMTSKSLLGAIKTSLWCVLMPFVVAIVLCLIGDSDAFLKSYTGGIVQNLESLIQLLIMTVILLMTPMITSKIMSDSGIATVAENIGQMAAMTTLVGGAGVIGGKAALAASTAHKWTTRPLMEAGKSVVSKKASNIMESKGVAPKVGTLNRSDGVKSHLKERGAEIKDAMKSTTLSEKITLGADAIVNRKENAIARVARREDAAKIAHHEDKKSELLPLSSYKAEAREHAKRSQQYREQSPTKTFRRKSEPTDRNLSPKLRADIGEKFGINPQGEAKQSNVDSPRESRRLHVEASVYRRMMKPKTIKELRDEKSFLR